ncbi:SGNH/GDSL hydrolase family protein [Leptolyngbya sp. NK1-12]|uniref:SGNH/GDSL hydrolase family protein n=1 Tax=Leptolyngbya sp. NK1-12 TaxID=2547451 RepID=A0AA96WBZ5_9CYAN|nr:SGNH/GDSL hydrolase family protein [Leptolyngbya sp. NK1-12]WNZ23542.1 SGNH/GDSL hydrolase family protein [Leptolyngbya sp. NK1-12]
MNHWIAGLLASGLLLELGLRLFGFGNPLIYIADPQIGYLLAPNQQTRRFGKRIAINQYSMRSPNITATRPPETLRVLLLGDSIVNGGWWTDQSQTISALLQQQLQSQSLPYHQVEVLNASANSWAPRNQLAYLQRFGSFEAQMIVLVINTDDLFAAAPTSVVVGRDRNYPNRKPVLGLIEVLQRYLLKPKPIPELAAVQAEAGDRVGANLAAVQQIQQLAEKQNAKFMLLMTPLLREVEPPGPRDYEQKARQRLQAFAQTNRIPLIDCLPLFNSLKQPETIYRDHIHLNPSGNQRVSTLILQQILALLHQE